MFGVPQRCLDYPNAGLRLQTQTPRDSPTGRKHCWLATRTSISEGDARAISIHGGSQPNSTQLGSALEPKDSAPVHSAKASVKVHARISDL